MYNVLLCTMRTHVFGPNFQENKVVCFNFFNSIFIYLYLEIKPIIIFQGIILHMDIVIAF